MQNLFFFIFFFSISLGCPSHTYVGFWTEHTTAKINSKLVNSTAFHFHAQVLFSTRTHFAPYRTYECFDFIFNLFLISLHHFFLLVFPRVQTVLCHSLNCAIIFFPKLSFFLVLLWFALIFFRCFFFAVLFFKWIICSFASFDFYSDEERANERARFIFFLLHFPSIPFVLASLEKKNLKFRL